MFLQKNDLILFQGDSITDAGRDRNDSCSLADGYVGKIAALLNQKYADLELKLLNRGVSGDRSCDMLARWQPDCLTLKPDVVSIMIGVNDTWRRYDSNILTTVDEYRRNIRTAFSSVKDAGWRLIVISPFLLPAQDKAHWREEDLNEKITACKQEAATYADIFIPMDDIFADRLQQNPAMVFADDGVHPNALGAQVIAEEWIAAVENA